MNKHSCVCNPGYRCDYSFSTKGEFSLVITRDQLAASRDAIIAQIARAAGVDPSQVEIVEVSGG